MRFTPRAPHPQSARPLALPPAYTAPTTGPVRLPVSRPETSQGTRAAPRARRPARYYSPASMRNASRRWAARRQRRDDVGDATVKRERPLAVRSAVEAASISRDSSAPHGVTPSYTVASRLREDTVRVSRPRSGSQARPSAKPEAPQPRGFDAGAAAQRPTSSSGHPQGRGAPGSG